MGLLGISPLTSGETAVDSTDITDSTSVGRAVLTAVDAAAARTAIGAGVGAGDVVGPASATDNAITRYDGTTGKLVQNSGMTIPDGAAGSINGTNTGDQTITLTGDVTGSGTGSFATTIPNDTVSYAKIQNVSATDRLLGRSTAGAGDVEEIACTAAGRAILDDATAGDQRTTLGLGTLATQSGTFSGTSSGTNTGDQTITLTGDATGSGTGSFAVTIPNDTVSYAKLQNVSATDRLLGRSTAGAGDVEEITCTAFARTLLDDADAATARTTLGISGSGDVVGPASATDNAITRYDGTTGKLVQNSGITIADGASGALSGTNTGDQTITLTGDATGSGTGSFAVTIPNDTVSYAKMQNVSATDRLLGRSTAGAGDVEEIACTAAGRALLDDADAAAQRATLDAQQDVFTTRGDLARAGASGVAERFAAVAADTFVGGDGTDVGVRTATQVRTSLFVSVYDLTSSTGWTTVNGLGTATITGGVLRLVHTVGADAYRESTVDYNGASAYRSLGMQGDFDVCVRLAAMSTESQSFAYLEIADASAAGERVSCRAYFNGTAQFFRNAGSADIVTAAARFGAYTGQEWLRVSVRGGHVLAYTGVGSGGARPTSWTKLGTASYAMSVDWSHVSCPMSVAGLAATSTIDFDDFTTVDLGCGL